jgi:hypothetical protein
MWTGFMWLKNTDQWHGQEPSASTKRREFTEYLGDTRAPQVRALLYEVCLFVCLLVLNVPV